MTLQSNPSPMLEHLIGTNKGRGLSWIGNPFPFGNVLTRMLGSPLCRALDHRNGPKLEPVNLPEVFSCIVVGHARRLDYNFHLETS